MTPLVRNSILVNYLALILFSFGHLFETKTDQTSYVLSPSLSPSLFSHTLGGDDEDGGGDEDEVTRVVVMVMIMHTSKKRKSAFWMYVIMVNEVSLMVSLSTIIIIS